MYCGKCGKEVPDNYSFCPFCGEKVFTQENIQQETENNDSAKQITTSNDKGAKSKKTKKKSTLRVVLGIAAALLLIIALTGGFDKIGEKIGYAPIFKGNDTTSAFKDTTGSTVSVSTELIDYVGKSEDEIVKQFGFKKNDSGIYPTIGTEKNNYSDYCLMFMCVDGKVQEVAVDKKTNVDFPNAKIAGVSYGMGEYLANSALERNGWTYLTEMEGENGSKRVSYYNSDFKVVTVEYARGFVEGVYYSNEDMSEQINAQKNSHEDSTNMENSMAIFDESQISPSDNITRLYAYPIAFCYLSKSDAPLYDNYAADSNALITVPAGTILPVYLYDHSAKYIYTGYEGIFGYINTDYLYFSNFCNVQEMKDLKLEYSSGNYYGIDNNGRFDLFFYEDLYDVDSPAYSVANIEFENSSYECYILGNGLMLNGLYRDLVFYLKDQEFIDTGKTKYLAVTGTEDGWYAEVLSVKGEYDDLISEGEFSAAYGD